MVAQGTAAPGRGPGSGQEDRQRGRGARARRRWRRLVVVLSGVLVLAIDTGAWAASGRPGGQVDHGHPGAGALAVHHRGQSHRPRLVVLASGGLLIPSPRPHPHGESRGVQLTVEASGDLLIHSPIFDRALALGGGRRYDFAPFFVRIRPYIRGTGLALCHVETPMTPAPPAG